MMIKLINKNTLKYGNLIEENRLTGYEPVYSVIDTTNLPTEIIDGETIVIYPDNKYIKGITVVNTLNGYDIVEIVEMAQAEKDAVDVAEQAILDAATLRATFIFNNIEYKYKLTSSIAISDELHPLYSVYKLGMIEDNPRIVIYDAENIATHIVSFWNEIKTPFMDIINTYTDLFTLKENAQYPN